MSQRRPLPSPFSDGPAHGTWRELRSTGRLNATTATLPCRPFSWQHGRSLWILDRETGGWVLAELRFDPQACSYREMRRALYDWPREAVGVLLGRAMAVGETHAEEIADRLVAWNHAGDSHDA